MCKETEVAGVTWQKQSRSREVREQRLPLLGGERPKREGNAVQKK